MAEMAKASTGVQGRSLGTPIPTSGPLPRALSSRQARLRGKIRCFWGVFKGPETRGSAPGLCCQPGVLVPRMETVLLSSPPGLQRAVGPGSRGGGLLGLEAEVPSSPCPVQHGPVGHRVRVWGPQAWPPWGRELSALAPFTPQQPGACCSWRRENSGGFTVCLGTRLVRRPRGP